MAVLKSSSNFSANTIHNLNNALKKRFAKLKQGSDFAIKSAEMVDGYIKMYRTVDKSDTPILNFKLPTEYLLDNEKTQFIYDFEFDATEYKNAVDPGLDGEPVLVLALKGVDEYFYSFVPYTALKDIYVAKNEDGNGSATVNISDYNIYIDANIKPDEGDFKNALRLDDAGLYVVDFTVAGATENNFASFGTDGAIQDSNITYADNFDFLISNTEMQDITDYSEEDIAKLFQSTFEEDEDGDIQLASDMASDIIWEVDGDEVMPSTDVTPQGMNGWVYDGDGDLTLEE